MSRKRILRGVVVGRHALLAVSSQHSAWRGYTYLLFTGLLTLATPSSRLDVRLQALTLDYGQPFMFEIIRGIGVPTYIVFKVLIIGSSLCALSVLVQSFILFVQM